MPENRHRGFGMIPWILVVALCVVAAVADCPHKRTGYTRWTDVSEWKTKVHNRVFLYTSNALFNHCSTNFITFVSPALKNNLAVFYCILSMMLLQKWINTIAFLLSYCVKYK